MADLKDSLIDCAACADQKWVCEEHPEKPWLVADGKSCCGAPGIPCEACNPCGGRDDPPDMGEGFINHEAKDSFLPSVFSGNKKQ